MQQEHYTSGFTEGCKVGYVRGYTAGYAAGKAGQSAILRKNLTEKQNLKTQLLKEIEEIKTTLPKLQADLKEHESEMSKFLEETRMEERRKNTELSDFERLRNQFNLVERRMGDSKDNREKIESLQNQIAQANESVQELQRKKNVLDRKMSGLESKVKILREFYKFICPKTY